MSTRPAWSMHSANGNEHKAFNGSQVPRLDHSLFRLNIDFSELLPSTRHATRVRPCKRPLGSLARMQAGAAPSSHPPPPPPVLRCWCLCRKNARRGDEKTSSCPTLPPPPARAPHPLAAAACPWAAASPCISGLDRAAAAHCEAHCCRLPPPLLRPALPRSSTATPPATPCTLSALASLFSPPRPPARPAVGPVVTKVEHYLRRGGGRQGRRRLDFFLAVAGWR